ncbi:macro domain-containing protein [Kitasatospora acidiphila]|uniref:macro domain-containing protein n=1 Tax=Kitasatospora acidiphila TaxID=2567942 RepID=UPI003C77C2E0
MSETITYRTGDATAPHGDGPRVIAHVCNDAGRWGRGIVVDISRRWPQPEAAFRQWYQGRAENDFGLGALQLVQVEPELWVANMVGQHGVRSRRAPGAPAPVRYEAIGQALLRLGDEALRLGASVHMPRIGCGLAEGRWEVVESLIREQLTDRGVPVTVYDLAGE